MAVLDMGGDGEAEIVIHYEEGGGEWCAEKLLTFSGFGGTEKAMGLGGTIA